MQDRERQPISALVSMLVQPAANSLALSASTMYFDNTPPDYHATIKAYPSHDFRILAVNNNKIQFECSFQSTARSGLIQCVSERKRITCDRIKPNLMHLESGSKC